MIDGIKNVLFTSDGKLIGVRAAIALTLTGAAAYLWIDGQTVPGELLALVSSVDAYYFGSRFAGGK